MHNYDVLRNTWIYQEIKQEVQSEVHQQHITELRQTLLEIIEARFPRLETLAKRVVEHITEPARVQALLVKVGTARIEQEARQGLSEIVPAQQE